MTTTEMNNHGGEQVNQEVIDMVNSIMHEQFEVPLADLKATANLKEDLKLDSLDFVDMVVLLEEKIGSQLTNIDFMAIKNLEDVYKLVAGLVSSKNS